MEITRKATIRQWRRISGGDWNLNILRHNPSKFEMPDGLLFMKNVKSRLGVLEYCAARSPLGKRRKWGFKFKSSDGSIVIRSGKKFDSLAKAEKGFFEAVKNMATNQYTISYPEASSVSRN